MAAGDTTTPLRALVYLACTQRPDGGFYQNFWINGEAYWQGIQLDEVAFPIVLAWRLREAKALRDFHPWPMVRRAASYLIHNGPATPEERWEENSGYSPSTLAAHIAGLICAGLLHAGNRVMKQRPAFWRNMRFPRMSHRIVDGNHGRRSGSRDQASFHSDPSGGYQRSACRRGSEPEHLDDSQPTAG